MLRQCLILMSLITLAGCNWGQYAIEQQFPATLIITNQTGQALKIAYVGSHSTEAIFSWKLNRVLKPDESFTDKISEGTWEAFRVGTYSISGECGQLKSWQKEGHDLASEAIQNQEKWQVTIVINHC